MTTHLSLHSLVYFIGILIFAAADDLVLPALTLENGPNDFLPQQPQTNNTVPADVSQNENSKTHAFKEEQDNVDEENDSSKPDTDTSDTFGERGGLLDLPVAIVSSNLTSQPVDSVATSTSESPQEQEDTEPSNKDISNSELIIGAKSGQPKNSVTIDNEDGGQLGQNNDTEISDSNSTLNDFHGKNVTANYSPWSQEDKLPVPPFDVLHLSDLTENGNLERFVHNETVDITTAEIDNTSAGIKDSDLLHTDGLNESSSSNQSGQEHVHGGSQYSLQYLLQQQQRLLSHQFQPQKQSSNQTDTAMLPDSHSQLGNQQHAYVEHAELPLPPTYNAELPVGKKGLSRQYHPQQQHQEQKGQLLELPRLPVYQDSPKEQQQQEQKEQPIELPKLPLYQYDVKEQQPLELPKLPLYQYDVKEQQPLELPKLPLYQNDVKEQQPLELPKLPLYQFGRKEQQQSHQQQPLELTTPPLYQHVTKEQQQQQPLELPKLPLYQNNVKEQQPLELPKLPLYQNDVKEQQPLELPKPPLYQNDVKEQQPLELPKLPLYQNDVKEQQPLELPKLPLYQNDVKEQQPLELPKPPLYPYGVKEQQQQLQPIELPKLPVYQYNPQKQQNQKEQTLELPKLTLYGDTQQEQIPQPQGNKYGQAELSQLPKEIAKLAGDMQKLPEVSQANGATSSDEGDSTDYSETGGSMMSSDENEYQSDYNPPVGPLGKQADTDYRQKSKWKSVYKVNNKGQDEWYKEATNDEGYYDEDGKAGEELKNNHWEGDKADGDEAYVNQESTYSDEEEPDDTKKTHAGDHDSGTPWDVDNSEGDDQDDLNSDKIHLVEDVVDEDLASRSRLPTAPTSMVVFYTWMIVAVLIFVVGISMYQSHCHGSRFRLPGSKPSSSGSDRKRLLDHEFV